MIKFLQDYRTKAIPPEAFEAGQEIERSADSERYFVGLGVAGYLIGGNLVDLDHQPIVLTEVVHVVATDRRPIDTGRGGEVLSLDAPARATSGPGAGVVIAHTEGTSSADEAVARLRDEFEAKLTALSEACQAAVSGLAGQLQNELSTTQSDLVQLREKLEAAEARAGASDAAHADAADQIEAAVARIGELEAVAKSATTDEAATPKRGTAK